MKTESSLFFTVLSHGACLLAGVIIGALVPLVPAPAPPLAAETIAPSTRLVTVAAVGDSLVPAAAPGADLAHQLADTQTQLEQAREQLAKKEDRLARAEVILNGLFGDAAKQADDDIKKGVKNSAFATLDDSSLFLGQLNKRYAALAAKYPTLPAPGTPERAAYDKEMADIAADTQTILQDSRLFGVFKSGDTAGIARSRSLQMQGELDLDPGQVTAVNSILAAAYAQGFGEQLNAAHRPAGDATAWQNARSALQNQTDTQIRAILTPAQAARFNAPGGQNQMWSLTIAGE